MKITAVEPDKSHNDQLEVYVDGAYSFSLSSESYYALNLYVDMELTPKALEGIKKNASFRSAKTAAIKFLSLKLRCSREIDQKLSSLGYTGDIVESVLDELNSLGYINDSMYVQKYIFDRSKLKPKSKKMLKLELLHKGISEEIIDGIINDYVMDEEVTVENLIRKKFGKYDFEDPAVLKRIYSFLHHRGYAFELISEVLYSMRKEPD